MKNQIRYPPAGYNLFTKKRSNLREGVKGHKGGGKVKNGDRGAFLYMAITTVVAVFLIVLNVFLGMRKKKIGRAHV